MIFASGYKRFAFAPLVVAGLTAMLLVVVLGSAPQSAEARRPSFVVIQTDDQTVRMLHSRFVDRRGRSRPTMPRTLRLIGERGVEFTNYYATSPVCSPSRSALLTGQYGHTSGLTRNAGSRGGAGGFAHSEGFRNNLAASLQAAGYRTAHFGRYLSRYGNVRDYRSRQVPPGWDRWVSDWNPRKVRLYYGYRLNIDGRIAGPFGRVNRRARRNRGHLRCPRLGLRCVYHTDQITTRAVRAIRRAPRRPIYIQVDYQAPHGLPNGRPAEPARRHIGSAKRTRLPRPPGFNEAWIGDKPPRLRRGSKRLRRREIRGLRNRWRRDLESLRSVDQGVGRILRSLRRSGRLANTYVFFTSDNGAFFGEHRYRNSKFLAYEPSANVPLLVRGPGVKRGMRSPAIVANVDLAPTIAELAGARLKMSPDGRSIRRLLRVPRRSGHRAIVLESYRRPSRALNAHLRRRELDRPTGLRASVSAKVPAVNYAGIRAGHYKYIEYEGGGREFYDLRLDPGEVANRIAWPAYRQLVRKFARQLTWRRFCEGADCRRGFGRFPEVRRPPHLRDS